MLLRMALFFLNYPVRISQKSCRATQTLAGKYAVTYLELDEQIEKSEKALSDMIDELTGNEYDMKRLKEFKSLLMGE